MTEAVYVIGSPLGGLVKIGRSVDVGRRLASIQRMSPIPLAVLFQTEGGTELERALHCHFQAQRTHGEWFDFGDEDLVPRITAALNRALPRPRGNTPLRNIRAVDEVWDVALANARAEGKTLTDVIVSYLKDYNAACAARREAAEAVEAD